jgi:predicted Fe-S protein YdhL (DUF1289 family)
MESPCIQVCVIDARSALCTGCGRTLAEVAAWSSMTPQERRKIMDELPKRMRRTAAAGG